MKLNEVTVELQALGTPETRVATGTLKHMGWDGASNPIIDLVMPCGCKWSRDGKVWFRSCGRKHS